MCLSWPQEIVIDAAHIKPFITLRYVYYGMLRYVVVNRTELRNVADNFMYEFSLDWFWFSRNLKNLHEENHN